MLPVRAGEPELVAADTGDLVTHAPQNVGQFVAGIRLLDVVAPHAVLAGAESVVEDVAVVRQVEVAVSRDDRVRVIVEAADPGVEVRSALDDGDLVGVVAGVDDDAPVAKRNIPVADVDQLHHVGALDVNDVEDVFGFSQCCGGRRGAVPESRRLGGGYDEWQKPVHCSDSVAVLVRIAFHPHPVFAARHLHLAALKVFLPEFDHPGLGIFFRIAVQVHKFVEALPGYGEALANYFRHDLVAARAERTGEVLVADESVVVEILGRPDLVLDLRREGPDVLGSGNDRNNAGVPAFPAPAGV